MDDLEWTERELTFELDRMESVYLNDNNTSYTDPATPNRSIGNISVFAIAEAEGANEELMDQVLSLQAKDKESRKEIVSSRVKISTLMDENLRLEAENELLKKEVELMREKESRVVSNQDESARELQDLEFMLGQTRAKFASALQKIDDLLLAKEFALQQLKYEQTLRLAMEKERDSYSAAYAAALEHSEKWGKGKVKSKLVGLF